MTKREKERFVKTLIATVRGHILRDISKLPTDWDGHELRRFIRDHFEIANLALKDQPLPEYRLRLQAYTNTVVANGLLPVLGPNHSP